MRTRVPIAGVALALLAGCASKTDKPTIPNRMADGSPCISLKVSLTCTNSTIEGQCTVAVQNISGKDANVHSNFAVGDRFEKAEWRNLFFKVTDIKGFTYRMNVRFPPSFELGESLMQLPPNQGKQAQYDVAVLHHRVNRYGNVEPLPFGDYNITAHYDVSQINQPTDMPFCEQVFASNRVRVEILGPNNNMSPLHKPNRLQTSPRGGSPVDGTVFQPQGNGPPM